MGRAADRFHADPEPHLRAGADMRMVEEIRQHRRHGPSHRLGDLDDRHVAAERDGGRGDFEPDEAGADDDNLLRRAQALAQRRRFRDGAQHMHALEVDPGTSSRRWREPVARIRAS